jgi:hypothetical protein
MRLDELNDTAVQEEVTTSLNKSDGKYSFLSKSLLP